MVNPEENEFRFLSYYDQEEKKYKEYKTLEVNREGIVRQVHSKEVLPGNAHPEFVEYAFPDMVVEEEWRPVKGDLGIVYEISARGAIRDIDTKVLLRTRAADKARIQPWLDEAFPELKN